MSTTTGPTLRWTLSRKISAVLAGVGVGLIVIATMSYTSVGSLRNDSKAVDHTYQVLEQITALTSSLKDAETGQRGLPDHRA